jgi:hypothetical protein
MMVNELWQDCHSHPEWQLKVKKGHASMGRAGYKLDNIEIIAIGSVSSQLEHDHPGLFPVIPYQPDHNLSCLISVLML